MTETRKRITDNNGVEYWVEQGPHVFGWTMCADGEHPANKAWGAHMKAVGDKFFADFRAVSVIARYLDRHTD